MEDRDLPKLIIARGELKQGSPTTVKFYNENENIGTAVFSFEQWIGFKKVLSEGIENLKRKQELRIEIVIKATSDGATPSLLEKRIPYQSGKLETPKVKYEISNEDVEKLFKDREGK